MKRKFLISLSLLCLCRSLWDEKKIPSILWGGGCLLCNQATSDSVHHPCGKMWWVMEIRAREILVLPLTTRHYQYCSAARGVPDASTGLICNGWKCGKASSYICDFVFLPIMTAARPHLPHLYLHPCHCDYLQQVPAAQGEMLVPLQFSGL